MQENNDLKELSEAAERVMGSDAAVNAHYCRNGTWFFFGAVAALGFSNLSLVSPTWTAVLALGIGWWINEVEAKRVRKSLALRSDQGPPGNT